MLCKNCKKMCEARYSGEEIKWQNDEMKPAITNCPFLAQMNFSLHFLPQTDSFTPTFFLFQASELEINRCHFIEHFFVV
jgi:hypothetical protein